MYPSRSIVVNDRWRPVARFGGRGRSSCALLAAIGALLTPSVATAERNAATKAPSQANVTQTAQSSNAVYRGSYGIYYDCDIAGFTGIYYGWWRGYVCQWNNWSHLWDLYA
jgi:hypothetical protein